MTSSQPNPYLVRFAGESEPVAAGQQIFTEGQPGDVMYVVKDGEVDVLIRNKVVETLGPGGILGEMALIDRNPRSATAIAKTDCQLVPINEARFTYLVQQTPYFALQVMRVMAQRLRTMDLHLSGPASQAPPSSDDEAQGFRAYFEENGVDLSAHSDAQIKNAIVESLIDAAAVNANFENEFVAGVRRHLTNSQ